MEHLPTVLTVLGMLYPPALFLLPPQVASKINLGVKVVKAVANTLDKAEKTNGGFTTEIPLNRREG